MSILTQMGPLCHVILNWITGFTFILFSRAVQKELEAFSNDLWTGFFKYQAEVDKVIQERHQR